MCNSCYLLFVVAICLLHGVICLLCVAHGVLLGVCDPLCVAHCLFFSWRVCCVCVVFCLLAFYCVRALRVFVAWCSVLVVCCSLIDVCVLRVVECYVVCVSCCFLLVVLSFVDRLFLSNR